MLLSNYTYLTRRLQEAGFGQDLNEILQNTLRDQPSSFELPYKVCFSQQILEITVYFKKWKEVENGPVNLYYLQKYHASLRRENRVDRIGQDFYFGNSTPSVPIQQAYNLLSGRAVYRRGLTNKDNATYNAWVQIDFSRSDSKGNFKWQYYTDNYGYDLAEELLKYPILGAKEEGEDPLVTALQQGYRELVTMCVGGKNEEFFIEAMPKFKSLVIFDASGNLLTREQKSEMIGQESEADELPEEERPKRKGIPL